MKAPLRMIANLISAVRSANYRFGNGVYGTNVVMTGPWTSDIAAHMLRRKVYELELNYIHSFQCDSYSFLEEVPFLVGLRIVGQDAKDFAPVNRLGVLRTIEIEQTPTPNVDFHKLPLLERVLISWFPKAERLFDNTNLKYLSLYKYPKQLSSQPFRTLLNLEKLRLADSGLSEVESLSELTGLRELDLLMLHHLCSLQGIESLVQLRKLRIESCRKIASIEPLRDMTQLEILSISDCGKIPTLEPIRALTRLRTLHFYGKTEILDGNLQVLRELTNLRDVRFANRGHYSLRREEFPPFDRD